MISSGNSAWKRVSMSTVSSLDGLVMVATGSSRCFFGRPRFFGGELSSSIFSFLFLLTLAFSLGLGEGGWDSSEEEEIEGDGDGALGLVTFLTFPFVSSFSLDFSFPFPLAFVFSLTGSGEVGGEMDGEELLDTLLSDS